ncbi:MAG: sensor histidine kinase [Deltaproteobacteria bacterium]|nr:MAG: sensor histidine kinase [Deltaproteobacteria bacterium]
MEFAPYQKVRKFMPWVQGLTLVVLAVVGIAQFVSLRDQLYQGVRRQAEDRLEERVRNWEEQLLDRLRAALNSAAEQVEHPEAALENIQDQLFYVESMVLWEPARAGPRADASRSRSQILYPRAKQRSDRLFAREHPCIAKAQQLQFLAGAGPAAVAEAYLTECAEASLSVRIEASIEAARVLERAGQSAEARRALESTPLPPDMTLRQGLELGLLADRMIVHRTRRAELLMIEGQEEASIDLYYSTGRELADLEAPDAIGLDTWRWALLDELRTHGRLAKEQRLTMAFEGLDRRIRAYNEVRLQLAPEPVALTSREPRLIRDQYVDRSYLIYYGIVETAGGTHVGVALQLDAQAVLSNFLATSLRDRDHMVILNASGQWEMGKRFPESEVVVQVPFSRTLTHLRVGLYDNALQARIASLQTQWLVPLTFTAVVLLVGIAALSIQITYARSREELLKRQRELTTRVTHELKTPLAGIKVMAENLELGAFQGDRGRRDMAQRIVEETDRLTQRIDELLNFSKKRTLPAPELFDVEELVFELVDIWGPRMEQHGVQLEADVDEAPQVNGDPRAVRDAIGSLLDNALKYRDPSKPTCRVSLELTQDGRDAVIRVTDNGLGVPPAMRKKVFERFVRIEGPNRGTSGGHGLGLSQVAATAARHRGTVSCTDGTDGGSTFTLRLRGEPAS